MQSVGLVPYWQKKMTFADSFIFFLFLSAFQRILQLLKKLIRNKNKFTKMSDYKIFLKKQKIEKFLALINIVWMVWWRARIKKTGQFHLIGTFQCYQSIYTKFLNILFRIKLNWKPCHSRIHNSTHRVIFFSH